MFNDVRVATWQKRPRRDRCSLGESSKVVGLKGMETKSKNRGAPTGVEGYAPPAAKDDFVLKVGNQMWSFNHRSHIGKAKTGQPRVLWLLVQISTTQEIESKLDGLPKIGMKFKKCHATKKKTTTSTTVKNLGSNPGSLPAFHCSWAGKKLQNRPALHGSLESWHPKVWYKIHQNTRDDQCFGLEPVTQFFSHVFWLKDSSSLVWFVATSEPEGTFFMVW